MHPELQRQQPQLQHQQQQQQAQPLKPTRLTRHSSGLETLPHPPANGNVNRPKPAIAATFVASTSPMGTERTVPLRTAGAATAPGRSGRSSAAIDPFVHHQQSVSVGRNKPIIMATSMVQPQPGQLPTATAAGAKKNMGPNRGTGGSGGPSDRNIDKVMFGDICFRAWYPSYYGKEVLGDMSGNSTKSGSDGKTNGAIAHGTKDDHANGTQTHGRRERDNPPPMLERLHVCPCCFKYSKELVTWWEHVRMCERRGFVPGKKIYVHPKGRRTVLVPSGPAPKQGRGKRGNAGQKMVEQVVQDEGEWSIWEVDGETDMVSKPLPFLPFSRTHRLTRSRSCFARTSHSSRSSS